MSATAVEGARILVFSTHNISDPGIDLAGQQASCTTRPASP